MSPASCAHAAEAIIRPTIGTPPAAATASLPAELLCVKFMSTDTAECRQPGGIRPSWAARLMTGSCAVSHPQKLVLCDGADTGGGHVVACGPLTRCSSFSVHAKVVFSKMTSSGCSRIRNLGGESLSHQVLDQLRDDTSGPAQVSGMEHKPGNFQ